MQIKFYIGIFEKYIYEKIIFAIDNSLISKISNILLIFFLYILIIHKINYNKIKNVFFLLLLNIFWFSKLLTSIVVFLEITCFQFDWSLPKNIINLKWISAHPRSKK